MLAFLTTLRHPLNSNSYAAVLELFQATLASMLAQSDDDFQVIVVANDCAPAIKLGHDLAQRVHVIEVDYPPPSTINSAATTIDAIRRDRGAKLVPGILHAQAIGADRVMLCDADDFIGRDIAAYVNAAPVTANGWYIDHGFQLKAGRIKPLDDFSRYCGTSHIIDTNLLAAPLHKVLPHNLNRDAPLTRSEIECTVEGDFLRRILGSHLYLRDYCALMGRPLQAYPFRAACWHLATGENHSDFRAQPRSAVNISDWPEVSGELAHYFTLSPFALKQPPAVTASMDRGLVQYQTLAEQTYRARLQRKLGIALQPRDDDRYPGCIVINARQTLLLSNLEVWVWEQCEASMQMATLLDEAVQAFPQRGAILDGEVLAIVQRYQRHGLFEIDGHLS